MDLANLSNYDRDLSWNFRFFTLEFEIFTVVSVKVIFEQKKTVVSDRDFSRRLKNQSQFSSDRKFESKTFSMHFPKELVLLRVVYTKRAVCCSKILKDEIPLFITNNFENRSLSIFFYELSKIDWSFEFSKICIDSH